MSKWYSFKELKRARTPMPLDSVTGLPDNHVITVVERVISVDDPELIQNNVRTDTFTLNLDAEYDDLNVVVIFTKPNNINVKVAYNGTPTHIPGSAMELVGSLACSVVGIDADGEVRAVTKAAPDTFQVVESGAYDGSVTSDDAELLGQILQAVSDAETAITEAETATTAATNATSQATSAATSANKAASSANSAASSANSAATRATSAAVNAENAYDTLQPYMATIDSCANILHREVGPDSVVTADDSFPCKPVEMVVYGNTVQNLWVNPSGTNNGITVTANADGSITVSGTATNTAIIRVRSYALKPSGKYTLSVDKSVSSVSGCGVSVEWYKDNTAVSNILIGYGSVLSGTFTISGDTEYCILRLRVASGVTVSGTYRVMLNEGSTAEPWCPPGLNSVGEDGSVKVVTAGKNLAYKGDITFTASANDVGYEGNTRVQSLIKQYLAPGEYVFNYSSFSSSDGGSEPLGILFVDSMNEEHYISKGVPVKLSSKKPIKDVRVYIPRVDRKTYTVENIQLELGSTATAYEPPSITTTSINLQGHSLNSLPDGTRDELHIDGGGNVVLEKRTGPITFDGTQKIAMDGVIQGRCSFSVSNMETTTSTLGTEDTGIRATTLPVAHNTMTNSGNPGIHRRANGGMEIMVGVGTANATTMEEYKSFLTAHPATVLYPLAEPQTIDLGTITPPTMAAPNVTAYVADDTPAEIELDYVRDINIVVDRLEKKVADLVVTEATIV